jgi:microcin C transport system ATP-binding protein
MSQAPTPLLSLRQWRVSFGGHEVVHGIDLDLAVGERLALVGESGSGKTVTALGVLRLLGAARLTGQCWFNGEDLMQATEARMQQLRGQDMAMIFQEPMTALNPLFTIGDQLSEVLLLKMALSRRDAWERSAEMLSQTGLNPPERFLKSYPHQLSGGQRQRAMIAMALACRPKLLLADEPTTALDVSMRGQILDLLDTLQRETGTAVLMITHDLNLVQRFADRVAVMEHGHVVEHGPVQQVLNQPQHPYTRKLVDSKPQRHLADVQAQAPLVAEVKDLRVSYRTRLPGWRGWFKPGAFVAVDQVNFSIRQGETLGVLGESGSGKSTLALALLGLLPFQGQLQVMGQGWRHHHQADLPLRRVVQVVFQDPFSSLSPRMTVEDVVGEGLWVHQPGLSAQARQALVNQVLAEVGMRESEFPGLLQRYPHEFSGGQRQRIAVARALVLQPQLLVLDEPTSALDVSIQKQLLQLLQTLQAERGLSYLLITHDMNVIQAMAHQVMVMKDGQVVEAGETQAVLAQPRHTYTQTLVQASTPAVARS